ncbi:hypothetical protein PtB15_6B383 [Puccinia triticina]|nr:hypothetical protein PtB15_6B383 [Puccinia triticina]
MLGLVSKNHRGCRPGRPAGAKTGPPEFLAGSQDGAPPLVIAPRCLAAQQRGGTSPRPTWARCILILGLLGSHRLDIHPPARPPPTPFAPKHWAPTTTISRPSTISNSPAAKALYYFQLTRRDQCPSCQFRPLHLPRAAARILKTMMIRREEGPPAPRPPFNPFAHRTPAVPDGELPDDGLDPIPMTPANQIYAHFAVVPLSADLATHFELEVMREAARDAMMISNVKAYARDTQERSVFRMVMSAAAVLPVTARRQTADGAQVVLPAFCPAPWVTIPHRRARCRSRWPPAGRQAPDGQLTSSLGPALYRARLRPTRRESARHQAPWHAILRAATYLSDFAS